MILRNNVKILGEDICNKNKEERAEEVPLLYTLRREEETSRIAINKDRKEIRFHIVTNQMPKIKLYQKLFEGLIS